MTKKLVYLVTVLAILISSLSIVKSLKAVQAPNSAYNLALWGDNNSAFYNDPILWWDNTNKVLNIGSANNDGSIKLAGKTSGSTTLAVGDTGILTIPSGTIITGPAISNTVVDATADTILTTAQCGSTVLLDKNNGLTVTLPAATTGCFFNFVNAIAYSSGTITVITSAGTIFIQGTTHVVIEATATPKPFTCNGSTHIKIAENGTTTGGILGGSFTLQNISATKWEVMQSTILGSGSIATPCST